MAATVRGRCIGVAALYLLAATMSGTALAGETTSPGGLVQTVDVTQSEDVVLSQKIRAADGSVPPVANLLTVKLPRGAEPDFGRFSKCHLGRLVARGPRGCPRGSKVGRGSAAGSYAQQPMPSEPVRARLWLYNGHRFLGRRTLLAYARPDRGRTWIGVGRWSRRSARTELDFQAFPRGVIPEGPQTYLDTLRLSISRTFLDVECGSSWSIASLLATGAKVSTSDRTACP